jgi:hypothetical protein
MPFGPLALADAKEVCSVAAEFDHFENRWNFAVGRRAFRPLSPLRPDSVKTYGNLARGTARRNTDGFPEPAEASLIGRLMAIPRKD